MKTVDLVVETGHASAWAQQSITGAIPATWNDRSGFQKPIDYMVPHHEWTPPVTFRRIVRLVPHMSKGRRHA